MTTFSLPRPRSAHPALLLDLGPVLVSDLPPAAPLRPSLASRLREELEARRELRQFERSLALASTSEAGDLLAIRRRD